MYMRGTEHLRVTCGSKVTNIGLPGRKGLVIKQLLYTAHCVCMVFFGGFFFNRQNKAVKKSIGLCIASSTACTRGNTSNIGYWNVANGSTVQDRGVEE